MEFLPMAQLDACDRLVKTSAAMRVTSFIDLGSMPSPQSGSAVRVDGKCDDVSGVSFDASTNIQLAVRNFYFVILFST